MAAPAIATDLAIVQNDTLSSLSPKTHIESQETHHPRLCQTHYRVVDVQTTTPLLKIRQGQTVPQCMTSNITLTVLSTQEIAKDFAITKEMTTLNMQIEIRGKKYDERKKLYKTFEVQALIPWSELIACGEPITGAPQSGNAKIILKVSDGKTEASEKTNTNLLSTLLFQKCIQPALEDAVSIYKKEQKKLAENKKPESDRKRGHQGHSNGSQRHGRRR